MQSTWWRTEAARRGGDAALGVAIFGIGLAGHIAASANASEEAAALSLATVLGSGVAAGLLWWRRQHLILVSLAILATVVVMAAVRQPGLFSAQLAAVAMVLSFTIGAWSRRLRFGAGVLTAVAALLLLGSVGDGNGVVTAGAFTLAVIALPAATGYGSRVRRLYLEEVEGRLAEAERDRDDKARRAIVDERTRIARELHDVVAHHVSLIGVQAGAARTAMERSPATTRAALEAIEASSRAAIAEMGHLLEALRPLTNDPASVLAPQPGLHSVPDLVARWRAAGYDIDLRIHGAHELLSPALSLCCHRVVEESIANLARHSQATSASIAVAVDRDAVTIAVSDPGPKRTPADVTRAGGSGHLGMVERAAIFGGRVSAGSTPDGGYAVTVYLPRGPS